jgi:hypothetical protein
MRLSIESRTARFGGMTGSLFTHDGRRSRRGTMAAAIADLPGFYPAV